MNMKHAGTVAKYCTLPSCLIWVLTCMFSTCAGGRVVQLSACRACSPTTQCREAASTGRRCSRSRSCVASATSCTTSGSWPPSRWSSWSKTWPARCVRPTVTPASQGPCLTLVPQHKARHGARRVLARHTERKARGTSGLSGCSAGAWQGCWRAVVQILDRLTRDYAYSPQANCRKGGLLALAAAAVALAERKQASVTGFPGQHWLYVLHRFKHWACMQAHAWFCHVVLVPCGSW